MIITGHPVFIVRDIIKEIYFRIDIHACTRYHKAKTDFLIESKFFLGLGDEWGAAPPPKNNIESYIKELGSHLLQVRNYLIFINV